MNSTGKNIKSLRQKKGWSQGEVAKRLNISVPAFSKIETGNTDINIKRLGELAAIFEVSVAVILSADGAVPVTVNDDQIVTLRNKLLGRDQDILELQKRIIDLYEIAAEKRRSKAK